MKSTILVIMTACMIVLAACGDSMDSKYVGNPNYQKGKLLVANNDCLTCHELSGTAVGPSYFKVAGKYADTEANIDTLAQKIVSGGSGNWGNIPMAEHAQLSLDDAKAMARYILLLKGK